MQESIQASSNLRWVAGGGLRVWKHCLSGDGKGDFRNGHGGDCGVGLRGGCVCLLLLHMGSLMGGDMVGCVFADHCCQQIFSD